MTTSTTFTIKQALAITPEAIALLPLDAMQALADALATSEDKRAKRKLDLVAGTLEGLRKQAKKAGDKISEAEFKAVENSVKKVGKKKPVVKAKPEAPEVAEESEQAELPLDDAQPEAQPEAPKKKPVAKPKTKAKKVAEEVEEAPEAEADKKPAKPAKPAKVTDEVAELKKQLAKLEKEKALLQAEIFPKVIEREKGADLESLALPTVQDVQKLLIERPLQTFLYVHEGLDDKPTAFTVLFMNEEILVLLDRSRQKNTTLTLLVKNMTVKTVKIDNRECPFTFYLPKLEAK